MRSLFSRGKPVEPFRAVASISRAPRNFVAHFVDAATLLHFRLFVDSARQVGVHDESPILQGHKRANATNVSSIIGNAR
jgi:hypothetical protein